MLQTEGRQAAQEASPGGFVLVQAPGRSETAAETPVLELLLERGWRLRIPRGVDEALLAARS